MSKSTYDPFRPFHYPASALYDALLDEATHRKGRESQEWIEKERQRMWETARDCALKLGKPVPTMKQVEAEERQAQGHCDYASKWAFGLHRIITTALTSPPVAAPRHAP